MIKFKIRKKFPVTNFGIQLVPCPTAIKLCRGSLFDLEHIHNYQGVFELRNNSCQPYFIVIQIWVGIIYMNI